MAGDPRVAVLLVGLGLDELSVSPFDVPRVKAALAAVDGGRAQAIARHCHDALVRAPTSASTCGAS
jgi:phosphoenolpyruvate-protein kinase (PTS system EI component)